MFDRKPFLTFFMLLMSAVFFDGWSQDHPRFLALVHDYQIGYPHGRSILTEVIQSTGTPEKRCNCDWQRLRHISPEDVGVEDAAFADEQQGGGEYHIKLPAPDGYTTCRAELRNYDPQYQAGPSDVTSNVRIVRTCRGGGEDNVSVHAAVPKALARVARLLRIFYGAC
jgi:hypothetical protein